MNKMALLEGLLFVVGQEGLTFKDLERCLELDAQDLNQLMNDYQKRLEQPDRGFSLELFGDKFKLTTKKEHHDIYFKLLEKTNTFNFSNASLETLAIIAYNQPITRLEVENIRGVNCDHIIRKLLSYSLIKEAGRKDSIGRAMMYEVTDEFFDTFKLESLEQLPKIVYEEQEDEENIFNTRYVSNRQEDANKGE